MISLTLLLDLLSSPGTWRANGSSQGIRSATNESKRLQRGPLARATLSGFFLVIAAMVSPQLLAADKAVGSSAEADAMWSRLVNLPTGPAESVGPDGTQSAEYWRWHESTGRFVRKLGLEFWRKFPHDERRYLWLYTTTYELAPEYWTDLTRGATEYAAGRYGKAPVDHSAKNEWAKQFVSLQQEYLTSSEVPSVRRIDWQWRALSNEIMLLVRDRRQYGGKGYDVQRVTAIANATLEFSRNQEDAGADREYFAKNLAYRVLDLMAEDPDAESSFVSALKVSHSDELQFLANAREQLIRLRRAPLTLQLATSDSKQWDLAKLRGKVVLVDFWALTCKSCIEDMPEVKRVYDKYRADGLEVVGVAFEEDKDRSKVSSLMQKMGIPWEQSLQGRPGTSPLWKRFGFIGVPVMFVIDRNGFLVVNDLGVAELEPKVRKLLGKAG